MIEFELHILVLAFPGGVDRGGRLVLYHVEGRIQLLLRVLYLLHFQLLLSHGLDDHLINEQVIWQHFLAQHAEQGDVPEGSILDQVHLVLSRGLVLEVEHSLLLVGAK